MKLLLVCVKGWRGRGREKERDGVGKREGERKEKAKERDVCILAGDNTSLHERKPIKIT